MESRCVNTVVDEACPVELISDAGFRFIIRDRLTPLLCLIFSLERKAMGHKVINRPTLGALLNQALQMEELLDSYGARNNRRWYNLRQCVSGIKLFANICYKLQHLHHSIPNYRLLPIKGDFTIATEQAVQNASDLTLLIATQFGSTARALELTEPVDPTAYLTNLEEVMPKGILMHDRRSRHIESAAEIVTHLCTAFLNVAVESDLLVIRLKGDLKDYAALIPDPFCEEALRQLEQKFHSLQSMYDTYVSDTDTEFIDPNLQVLRGHVSVIFHLLEAAVGLGHYYERHVSVATEETRLMQRLLVNPSIVLQLLMDYAITYAGRYLKVARDLCQTMLSRYAVIESISLPVPRYRGFHVRPSTLVAKIAMHYGSQVTMKIEDEEYDARMPLELFRANEKINARKRKQLAEEVAKMRLPSRNSSTDTMLEAVHRVVLELAAARKVIIYEQPLPLDGLNPDDTETLPEFVSEEIARLLAMGKIDIPSNLMATFTGDKRVLADIKHLADNGYGEDNFGNNIPLPPEINYLRR